jgi:Ca2+-binding EF-hand superfamily protein
MKKSQNDEWDWEADFRPPQLVLQERPDGHYTPEENARAYQLFTALDQNHSGNVSVDELECVLEGKRRRTFTLDFLTVDTGIVFGLEDGFVIVKSIEKASPAYMHAPLVDGLRLISVNEQPLATGEQALHSLRQQLYLDCLSPLRLEFFVPLFTISDDACTVDVEIKGRVYTTRLALGAVNDAVKFATRTTQTMHRTHKAALSHIDLRVEPNLLRFSFESRINQSFRLLWGTGPTAFSSVRFVLGFGTQNSTLASKHIGRALQLDFKLNVTSEQLAILMDEIFRAFDRNGSKSMEFEEFRNMYVCLLDTTASRESLREYAVWKFRDVQREEALR